MIGLECAYDFRDLRAGVLRVLRFVEDERAETPLRQELGVQSRQRIRRHDDVVGVDRLDLLCTLGPDASRSVFRSGAKRAISLSHVWVTDVGAITSDGAGPSRSLRHLR